MSRSKVIENQERILANQDQIKRNQVKLDLLLASQETILANQEKVRELENKLSRLLDDQRNLLEEPEPISEMVGSCEAFQRALKDALNVADTDTLVLLRGETGTGKELLAQAIHAHSSRRNRPFVIVNCAALPASLIESELFGYEKGAFTGATQRKVGRFELSNGGTIFLDEIGEVPLEVQGRFLRVLQTGIFERLGGTSSVRVKVRIIAATNQPLEHLVNERRFRADLFYRLNVFPITLPPLRERRKDIPLLVQYFVKKYCARFNRVITSISGQSMEALQQYNWPGNVRELEHLLERAVLTSEGDVLQITLPAIHIDPVISIATDLRRVQDVASPPARPPVEKPLKLVTLAENERAYIQTVLRQTRGRISGMRGAAAILGLPPSPLRSRIKKLGLTLSDENGAL